MNVGLPGTGIGGLFYILSALWAPIDGAIHHARGRGDRIRWGLAVRQAATAAGILAMLWAAGWGLGFLLTPGRFGFGAAGEPVPALSETISLIRWVALLGTAGVLAAVMAFVQLLRFTAGRKPRQQASSGSPPDREGVTALGSLDSGAATSESEARVA